MPAKSNITLQELLQTTEALTYLNALKVTLTEIKTEMTTQDQLRDYMNQSGERTKKLMRRADGQYRMVAKLVNNGHETVANNITVEDSLENFDEMKQLMEDTK